MLHYSQKSIVAVILLAFYMPAIAGEGFTEELSAKLVMNPNKTDVYLGADPIALTVRVKGKNLSYEWKLLGPGELEGQGSSVFYILPEKIDDKSAQALITVKVTDEAGEEVTESVTFNILVPTSSASEGMSRTTKMALGAGAIVALGGGIALAAGDGGSDGGNDGDAAYNIVGRWDYSQDYPDFTVAAEGILVFSGSASSGTSTQIDNANNATYNGSYTVNGVNVSISGPVFLLNGVFKSETEMEGTWHRVDDSSVAGTWWACVEGTC